MKLRILTPAHIDMFKAKDGEFFIADWLRNGNTVEFLGIWESVFNPGFHYGEFATIRSQAGLNSYKISVKEWDGKNVAMKHLTRMPQRKGWLPSLPFNESCHRQALPPVFLSTGDVIDPT